MLDFFALADDDDGDGNRPKLTHKRCRVEELKQSLLLLNINSIRNQVMVHANSVYSMLLFCYCDSGV